MGPTNPEPSKIYFEDAYQTGFEARVVERLVVEGRPAVVLDRTCFYAESGGQPWDLGTISGIPVLRVMEESGRTVHVLERDVAGEEVRGEIDWPRRFDHMQQHTGQHVLSQAFLEILRGETRSFHMGAESSTLEIGIPAASEESLDRVELRANAIVFQDRPVRTSFVEPAKISEVPLRRPPKVEGTIRVVEIEGFDWSACGGTHCRRTGEIGLIKTTGAEKIRGNLRFGFVCGGRALADYQVKNRVARGLAAKFSVPEKDVPASVEKLSSDLKALKKSLRSAEETAAGFEARDLAARAGTNIIALVFPDKTPEAARTLALNLVRLGEYAAVFAAKSETRAHIFLARSAGLTVDLRTLVPILAPLFDGKGGGGPSLVEIAGRLDADLGAIVEKAAEILRS